VVDGAPYANRWGDVQVEVTFAADGTERTRVTLVHRNLERHGAGWESMRDGVGNDQGWPLYLRRYQGLVQSGV
jgi:hypothetical protein